MGIFERLFKGKKTSSSSSGSYDNKIEDNTIVLEPKRKWTHIGGAVKDGIHVFGSSYFQDQIKKCNTHTIEARLVTWKNVKHCAVEWYSKDDVSQIYVVDSEGSMLGYIYKDSLPKIGYAIGDKVQVAVTEKYTNDSLSLFILQNKKGIEHCEQQKNLNHRKKHQPYLPNKINYGDELIHMNLSETDVNENLITEPSDCALTTSWIPTPKGSKAKPHIAINNRSAMIAEIGARNSCYKDLAAHVGEKPKQSALIKKESNYKDGGHYWAMYFVY